MTQVDEAARWFAILRRGMISLESRAAYAQWLSRRENRDAMAAMEDIWSMLDATPKPAALPRQARRAILSAICACSLLLGTLSAVAGTQYWTRLDWTNR